MQSCPAVCMNVHNPVETEIDTVKEHSTPIRPKADAAEGQEGEEESEGGQPSHSHIYNLFAVDGGLC